MQHSPHRAHPKPRPAPMACTPFPPGQSKIAGSCSHRAAALQSLVLGATPLTPSAPPYSDTRCWDEENDTSLTGRLTSIQFPSPGSEGRERACIEFPRATQCVPAHDVDGWLRAHRTARLATNIVQYHTRSRHDIPHPAGTYLILLAGGRLAWLTRPRRSLARKCRCTRRRTAPGLWTGNTNDQSCSRLM